MSDNFRIISESDFGLGHGDTGHISNGTFEILKSDYKSSLLEKILWQYGTNKIKISDDVNFNNEYKRYTDLYIAIINGKTAYYPVENRIFEDLARAGYINNGLLNKQEYQRTQNNEYKVTKPFYNRLERHDKRGKEYNYQTKNDIFEMLIDYGLIVKIADNTYEYVPVRFD